ncbi:MAG: FtsQ-type POTRA domain-containing protein [Selenomonadaceae bacterium]|nr:FtsQ-type POTRA domain-containing protein [Selenomonadaceae bacterium]MBQ3451666.1 FtsQ-type POTRA domain-containing protein [Selenomonadaceae bacterium]MBQ4403026.1 FtsQ-type POTRA domain-containing protein [Selenomonadaceae bacterium]MBQ6131793.1 FtsQ-type POTRA domain-containing protein [Selenomonadaceae bacterium]MBQ7492880.1 FtsQ-type POTRA domain-containing protein [Selenomonadaceae bacterium]
MAVVKRRRRSFGRLFRGIIFLVVSAAVLGVFVYVPFFTLNEIRLEGAKYLTEEDILRIGDIYMGEPLFKLETNVVQSRLSKDLRIEEVSVRRKLPHTLEIKIKERRPLATINCDYGYLDLDHNGVVLDSYKTIKTMQIPMITGAAVRDLYIGDTVENEQVRRILDFLQRLNEDTLNLLSEIAIVEQNYIVMYSATERPVQIRIGKLERLDEKARLTEDFLRDLATNPHPVEYVDFNYTAPFIKLAD